MLYHPLLDTFVCAADCGSLSRAAEKLFLSPTAVKKQLDSLEKLLDLQLLERTHQGVKLTPAGEALYRDALYLAEYSRNALEKARKLAGNPQLELRVGTSMLNPCKALMDVWGRLESRFPRFRLRVLPFEDDQETILSVLDQLGRQFDFIVGVCDSAQWRERCGFYPLGYYKKCISVPLGHPLARRDKLRLEDLHGETLMMVRRGDSPLNDRLREDLETHHPQIRLVDAGQFYDIRVFNQCVQRGCLLLNLECWKDIHPSLVTLPVDWEYAMPYGLLYSKNPRPEVRQFLQALSKVLPPL